MLETDQDGARAAGLVDAPYDAADRPARPGRGRRSVNVMTIDVEDYFHVSALRATSSPRDTLGRLRQPRRRPTRSRCSTIFAEARRARPPSSSSAGWPSATRTWSAASSQAGHELASHSYWHRLVYDLTPASSATICGAPARSSSRGPRRAPVRGFRAPSYSITRAVAVGARRPDRGGLRLRREHLPDPPRSLRHPDAPRHAHRVARPAARSSSCRRRPRARRRPRCPIGGGYFRLLPYSVTRWAIGRSTSATSGRPCSTCIRGRSIPTSRAWRRRSVVPLAALQQPGRDRAAAPAPARRLPVGSDRGWCWPVGQVAAPQPEEQLA